MPSVLGSSPLDGYASYRLLKLHADLGQRKHTEGNNQTPRKGFPSSNEKSIGIVTGRMCWSSICSEVCSRRDRS
jgi:hypothetical protein